MQTVVLDGTGSAGLILAGPKQVSFQWNFRGRGKGELWLGSGLFQVDFDKDTLPLSLENPCEFCGATEGLGWSEQFVRVLRIADWNGNPVFPSTDLAELIESVVKMCECLPSLCVPCGIAEENRVQEFERAHQCLSQETAAIKHDLRSAGIL